MNIWLNVELVEKCKQEIVKKGKEELDEDNKEGLFDSNALTATVEELYFKDGFINFCYMINYKGAYLMTYSDDVEIDIDMGAEIITYFMKKLGKLKTILEATK